MARFFLGSAVLFCCHLKLETLCDSGPRGSECTINRSISKQLHPVENSESRSKALGKVFKWFALLGFVHISSLLGAVYEYAIFTHFSLPSAFEPPGLWLIREKAQGLSAFKSTFIVPIPSHGAWLWRRVIAHREPTATLCDSRGRNLKHMRPSPPETCCVFFCVMFTENFFSLLERAVLDSFPDNSLLFLWRGSYPRHQSIQINKKSPRSPKNKWDEKIFSEDSHRKRLISILLFIYNCLNRRGLFIVVRKSRCKSKESSTTLGCFYDGPTGRRRFWGASTCK